MPSDNILTDDALQSELDKLSDWEVRDGRLRRKFKTPGWSHTMLLANTIAYIAEAGNHHPDLELGYAQVIVKLQTHSARAITTKDTELAHRIDEVALWQPADEAALDGFPKNWVK